MRRMATAMLLVGVCVAGGMTPAFADEAPEGVLEAIVADTAPARMQGDELVAEVGDVRAEIPVDTEEPLTLQSGNGPEISITLPRGDGQEAAVIAAPWAVDASGKQIPTRLVVEQSRLTQIVDTASVADVQYPVVADPAVSVTSTQYRVVDVTKTTNWTNRAKQIGLCKIERGGGGGQCTISASRQVSTSVGVSLGAPVGDVAAGLNFSVSNVRTVSVSWTSPPSPVGSSYKAWATGTRATYRIQKWVGHRVLGQSSTRWQLVGTSGILTAFTPNAGFAIGQ